MNHYHFKKAFKNIVVFPFKFLSWLMGEIVAWGLRLFFILSWLSVLGILASTVWFGFFIHKNIDRPMSYTPVPVAQQPPDGLTFRQFYQGVKGYYLIEDGDHELKFVRKYGYMISLGGSLPFAIAQTPRDAWVLTHPDSPLKEHIPSKDYKRFVEPLEDQFEPGLKDFPEALWLQIESSYWYWDHERFLEFYSGNPELIIVE